MKWNDFIILKTVQYSLNQRHFDILEHGSSHVFFLIQSLPPIKNTSLKFYETSLLFTKDIMMSSTDISEYNV